METFELAEWWNKAEQKREYKHLSVVACGLLGTKPRLCGLDCDIGRVSDVVHPKRGSINLGMIEVGLFLKLNRKEMIRDCTKIECLGKSWENKIPTRPNYPSDYFDESDEKDSENEDPSNEASDSE